MEGNIHNSTQSILGYLEKIDVRHGVSKKKIDCAVIAEKLRENLILPGFLRKLQEVVCF